MAFWDNWFKVACQGCRENFAKEELVPYDDLKVCSDCHEEMTEKARLKAIEVEERRAAEEAARAALLDRPIDVSGKSFGASYDDVASNTGKDTF